MVWSTYKEKIKRFSERIVEAQRPIRILDAIKWDGAVLEAVRKSKYRELPAVGPEYYEKIPLGYDPAEKIAEFHEIRTAIWSELGEDDALGRLLREICREYALVVEMLQARGTQKFGELSSRLYGSPKDRLFGGEQTVTDLGRMIYSIFNNIDDSKLGVPPSEEVSATEVVETLNRRFKAYFHDDEIQARLSDGIDADAAAGSDVVKIKEGARFTRRDIDILEVHEGWVHVGTTQNGLNQPIAKWLSKGPPRCAATQEGLAVIMEIFTFRTYPKRARAINDRILAIDKAMDGANFLEILEFYRTEGYSEDESLANARRICRGGLVTGGAPFTKDLSYCRGFIENYNFIRTAIRSGRPELLPCLFAGKMKLEDVPLIYAKIQEGVIEPPKYLPPAFSDLNGLVVWMGFSNFLNLADLSQLQAHYDKLFSAHL